MGFFFMSPLYHIVHFGPLSRQLTGPLFCRPYQRQSKSSSCALAVLGLAFFFVFDLVRSPTVRNLQMHMPLRALPAGARVSWRAPL